MMIHISDIKTVALNFKLFILKRRTRLHVHSSRIDSPFKKFSYIYSFPRIVAVFLISLYSLLSTLIYFSHVLSNCFIPSGISSCTVNIACTKRSFISLSKSSLATYKDPGIAFDSQIVEKSLLFIVPSEIDLFNCCTADRHRHQLYVAKYPAALAHEFLSNGFSPEKRFIVNIYTSLIMHMEEQILIKNQNPQTRISYLPSPQWKQFLNFLV